MGSSFLIKNKCIQGIQSYWCASKIRPLMTELTWVQIRLSIISLRSGIIDACLFCRTLAPETVKCFQEKHQLEKACLKNTSSWRLPRLQFPPPFSGDLPSPLPARSPSDPRSGMFCAPLTLKSTNFQHILLLACLADHLRWEP